tara:strand:+ start:15444 stop:15791 length:348 start_codon:yes stop_codon:yes gene_type:complete
MKISQNFSREEFACNCGCGGDTVDYETILVLEDVRAHFKEPVTINSAYRCLEYNRGIGSNDGSQHPKGRAVDIVVKNNSPRVVHFYLCEKYKDKYGIGGYDIFTHIDTRSTMARW